MTKVRNAPADCKKIMELTEILTGALTEGVDLGSRETQIRAIGEGLEISLQYLRLALANIDIDVDGSGIAMHLDQIDRMAKIASSYKN